MANGSHVHEAFVSIDSALNNLFVDDKFSKPVFTEILQSLELITTALRIDLELYFDWSSVLMAQVMEDAVDLQATHSGITDVNREWLRPKFDSIFDQYKLGSDTDCYAEDILEFIEGLAITAPEDEVDVYFDFNLFD